MARYVTISTIGHRGMQFNNLPPEKAGTELQIAVYDSAVYNAGLAPRIGFLGHVRTNNHGFEVAKLAVFSNTVKTIVEYIKKNS